MLMDTVNITLTDKKFRKKLGQDRNGHVLAFSLIFWFRFLTVIRCCPHSRMPNSWFLVYLRTGFCLPENKFFVYMRTGFCLHENWFLFTENWFFVYWELVFVYLRTGFVSSIDDESWCSYLEWVLKCLKISIFLKVFSSFDPNTKEYLISVICNTHYTRIF